MAKEKTRKPIPERRKKSLNSDIEQLKIAITTNTTTVPGKINNQLLKLLLEENIATINEGKLVLDKNVNIKTTKPTSLKKKQIINFLKYNNVLPTITGHLVLSTTKGLMSHQKAIKESIGGVMIAVIY